MSIKVDEWGNVWNADDTVRTLPAWPHPELEEDKARCPTAGHYVYRTRESRGDFVWRCACGTTYPGLHH